MNAQGEGVKEKQNTVDLTELLCSVLMLFYSHIQLERPVVPDLLGLAALQLLQVEGQWQQQVAEVLTGEGEGVVGHGLGRWRGEGGG